MADDLYTRGLDAALDDVLRAVGESGAAEAAVQATATTRLRSYDADDADVAAAMQAAPVLVSGTRSPGASAALLRAVLEEEAP